MLCGVVPSANETPLLNLGAKRSLTYGHAHERDKSSKTSRRLLTLSPDNEPLWVHLYVHQIGEKRAAMLLADGAPPPEPGSLTGQAFFGETPEEAERAAKAYMGCAELAN